MRKNILKLDKTRAAEYFLPQSLKLSHLYLASLSLMFWNSAKLASNVHFAELKSPFRLLAKMLVFVWFVVSRCFCKKTHYFSVEIEEDEM